ncbi:MAG: MBL fold metallo-hydrolase [Acidobacteria bacterium]|nr:MAG: MBL fold metallo-hydrolase [Acidobacteriota bacterium]PYV76071.1 MAG: MBL fold metallo-hydrolase [Acidobacteriota bacterium]
MPFANSQRSIANSRISIGDFELTAVSDGIYRLDGGALFGIVPKVLWSKRVAADEKNLVPVGLNSVLVRTGEKNILIENGIGNKLSEKMIEIYGEPAELLDKLNASGVSPDEIDIVINSHLHFDHCGWNTVRRNGAIEPTFPKATYYVQEGEWKHAHEGQRDSVSYLHENYDPLVQSGRMKLLRGNQEIVPGISVQVFPGHTRDMQAVVIQSQGKTACYISDLVPTSAHIEVHWVMSFDLYPLETIESRKRYYARAIPEKWLTMFTHDPEIPWAYVQKDERGKIVAPKFKSL